MNNPQNDGLSFVEFVFGLICEKCKFVNFGRLPVSPFGYKIFWKRSFPFPVSFGPLVFITSQPPGFGREVKPDCIGISLRDVSLFGIKDIVLFEGYISDPMFDLDKILGQIRWRYFRFLVQWWFCVLFAMFCGSLLAFTVIGIFL